LSNFEKAFDIDAKLKCRPLNDRDPRSGELSPTSVLLDALSGDHLIKSSSNSKEINQFVDLLSSVMMNGLPLLGIDDFIYLSDFFNEKLGREGKQKLLESSIYRSIAFIQASLGIICSCTCRLS
jgi:hypothetical protein